MTFHLWKTWKWFDLAIVIMAVVVGFAVWFIPSIMNNPEMKKFIASQNEIKKQNEAYEKMQAEIEKEREELGLVYLPTPPTVAKPAPKKDQ